MAAFGWIVVCAALATSSWWAARELFPALPADDPPFAAEDLVRTHAEAPEPSPLEPELDARRQAREDWHREAIEFEITPEAVDVVVDERRVRLDEIVWQPWSVREPLDSQRRLLPERIVRDRDGRTRHRLAPLAHEFRDRDDGVYAAELRARAGSSREGDDRSLEESTWLHFRVDRGAAVRISAEVFSSVVHPPIPALDDYGRPTTVVEGEWSPAEPDPSEEIQFALEIEPAPSGASALRGEEEEE